MNDFIRRRGQVPEPPPYTSDEEESIADCARVLGLTRAEAIRYLNLERPAPRRDMSDWIRRAAGKGV